MRAVMQKAFSQAYFLDFAKRLDMDLKKQMKIKDKEQAESDRIREDEYAVKDRKKRNYIPEHK